MVNTMRHLDKLTDLWNNGEVNLNAGCGMPGTCMLPPFINFDWKEYPTWGDDEYEDYVFQVGDVRSLPYENNYFDVVFGSEIIEHFMYGESIDVLREFYRVLKSEGCLKIICPNFEYAIKIYRGEIQYSDWDIDGGLLAMKDGVAHSYMGPIFAPLYSHQWKVDGQTISDHCMVWDEKALRYYLNEIGFIDVERVHDKLPWKFPHATERDLCFEAWKP